MNLTNTCWQYRQTRRSVPVVCQPTRRLTCGPLLPFHAKEMFVQLHKGFSEIIDHFRYIQIQLDSES